MGAGGASSGGTYVRIDGTKPGDLPTKGAKPNSRYDLYINGERVQSRWFDYKGDVLWNRDYKHQDAHHNHTFPHDHRWEWKNGEPHRNKDGVDPDYEKYY